MRALIQPQPPDMDPINQNLKTRTELSLSDNGLHGSASDKRPEEILSLEELCIKNIRELKTFEPFFASKVLSNDQTKIKLADFQRGYCWSEDLIDAFLKNFSGEKERSCQLGSVVFLIEKTQKNFSPTIEIIDGQQRLITLWLAVRGNNANKIASGSFFKTLENSLVEADIPSKIRCLKNADFIKHNLSDLSISKKNLKNITFAVYIFEDRQKALNYFVKSNTQGVQLTAGQLLKAFHYSQMKDEKQGGLDKRYTVEAWRLGLIKDFEDFQDFITDENLFSKIKESKSPLDANIIPRLSRQLFNTNELTKDNKNSDRYTLENFIANNHWNDAFYTFQGFFNTLQLVIYGGEAKHNSVLATPIFWDHSQNFPFGLERMKGSESGPIIARNLSLLERITFIQPGLNFFQTLHELLVYYIDFVDKFNLISKENLEDATTNRAWVQLTLQALESFREDYCRTRKVVYGEKEEWDKRKFYFTLIHKGVLLSLLCLSLLFELRFKIGEADKKSKEKFINLLYQILWSGMLFSSYDTCTRATGVYAAGPIISLSPSFSIAAERMSREILSNNSKLRGFIDQLNIKQGDISNFKTLHSIS